MPIYAYTAMAPSGALTESKVEAASEAQARMLAQRKGERVVRIRELAVKEAPQPKAKRGKKASPDEIATTIRQMSILIKAGVPLVEVIEGIGAQAKSEALSRCLQTVALDVSHGTSLSDAFAAHPAVFPKLAVEMAKIAEAGGNLSESMERLADHMESSAEITRKVKSALSYPIVVLCISAVTVLVMVTFILPKFMKLFEQMKAEIPWTTKMLMAVSHAFTSKWYLFIGAGILGFHLFKRYAQSPAGKQKLDSIALKLPLVGDIVSKIVLSRAIASMATLLSSGVPMVQTLETSAAAANNEVVKAALLGASKAVAEGDATSDALRAAGVFPPLVLQMVSSGEKTGELPSMLDYVCTMYGRETDAKVKSLTSVIEPIMIVLLGIIVGFIAMSVIVPIYSLVGGVK